MTRNTTLISSLLLSLLSGLTILIYFDEGTLFLATLLVAIIAVKTVNKKIETTDNKFSSDSLYINSFTGLWFALSIAPAFGVSIEEITSLSNGFIVQAIFSLIFFTLFHIIKPSIIGRIFRTVKGGVGIMASTIIAGAAAGISSSSLWQVYLQLTTLF